VNAKLAKAVQDLDRYQKMIDSGVVAEYRKIRREHTGIGSKLALDWARANLNTERFPDGFNVNGRTFVVDGFDVKCGSEYDEDAETDWLGEWTNNESNDALRNPNAWTSHGNPYGNEYRYFVPMYSERERFNDLHKAGMAKGPARKLAHEQTIKDMELARDITQYVVFATVSRHGVELGHVGIGGVDEDYIEGAILDHDLIGEAIEQAKATLAKLCESEG
jgi:hypothetical protein